MDHRLRRMSHESRIESIRYQHRLRKITHKSKIESAAHLKRFCSAPCLVEAMHWPAPEMAAAAMTGVPLPLQARGMMEPWMVADDTINAWLSEMNLPTKQKLTSMTAEQRGRVVLGCYHKYLAGALQNPEAYLCGAINRELTGCFGPMKSAGTASTRSPYQGGAYAPPQTSACPAPTTCSRPPASPQQGAPPRPSWVVQAWELHARPKELFRFLGRFLPTGTLSLIADLPGNIQYNMLLMMILADRAHHEPVGFLQYLLKQYTSLPAPAASLYSSTASVSSAANRRKIIVLSFGLTAALEWPAIDIALNIAKDEMNESFQVVGKYSFVSQCVWKEVLDDFFASVSGPKVEPVLLEDAVSYINANGLAWKATGATIFALIHIPKPEPSNVPGLSAAPSYHGHTSASVWQTFAALRSLEKFTATICVAAFLPPSVSGPDASFFDVLFGPHATLPAVNTQVPQAPWPVRCVPRAAGARQIRRPIVQASLPVEDFNVALRGAFDGAAAVTKHLPPVSLLEALFDVDEPSRATPEMKEAGELVRRGPASGDQAGSLLLLSREHLCAVCGLDDWKLCGFWNARMPCSQHVNAVTGQPAAAGSRESVPCGAARWCPQCVYFYETLTDCVSPWLISNAVLAVLQALAVEDVDSRLMSVKAFPDHQCGQSCTGFSYSG